jgi:hypothetical protein
VPRPRSRLRTGARRAAGAAVLVGLLLGGSVAGPVPAVGAGTVTGPPANRVAAADPSPVGDQALPIRLDSLTPAVVPRRGPVRMAGSVTNATDEPWTDIDVYAFASRTPLRTEEELDAALASDPEAVVGERVLAPRSYDTVGDLAPGETARFSVRVPRSRLPIPADRPGVYWLGVHALGANADGRDDFADGRARTFVAAVPRSAPTVPVAVVAPLRRPVVHTAEGSIDLLERWERDLGPRGPLRAMLDLGASSSGRPLTWLVDPAVLEAVQRLAAGNPGRSLEPTLPDPDAPGDPGEQPSGSASPGGSAPPDPTGSGTPTSGAPAGSADGSGDGGDAEREPASDPPTPQEQRVAALARAWLSRAEELLGGAAVLALPYADLDVAAAAHQEPGLIGVAVALSARSARSFGLTGATPVAAPPGGRLDAASIRALDPATRVVLDRAAVEEGLDGPVPAVTEVADHLVVLADGDAAAGGPGPDAPLASVAVRQRLLAEAALAALDDASPVVTPVVAVLPDRWNPADGLGFFRGLGDASWVGLRTVADVVARGADELDAAALGYGDEQLEAEVPPANVRAVAELLSVGELLESVLTRNDQVGSVVAREALGTTSYAARRAPVAWRRVAGRITADIGATLGRVSVEAPEAVTLSSERGSFPASLANELDEPVTVRIEARTSSPLTIEAPAEITLRPGERTSVLLTASTRQIGRHDVQLLVTSTDGIPLGSTDEVEIRSAQVSWIIWVVIAGGATLLFGAIGVRVVRRVRAARAAPGVAGDPEAAA